MGSDARSGCRKDGAATSLVQTRVDIMSTQHRAVGKAHRDDGLRAILASHRAQLAHDVRARIRAVRHDNVTRHDVVDDAESSEADIQDDVGVAVLQLAADTLEKIEAALRRLDGGEFGACADCGDDIGDAR
jgi:RNA polymerase-binding transcription factor DksA